MGEGELNPFDTPHVMTVRAGTEPYGCKDREYSPGYFSPQREYQPDGDFKITTRYLLHKMSRGCGYDRSLQDSRCEGCKHRGRADEQTQRQA